MKSLKLFKNSLCPYCHRVAITAKEKGVLLEEVEIPLGDDMPQWYKELNTRETVPFLQVDGKKGVYESELIARYIDSVSSPAGSLLGSTPFQRHRVEFFLSQVVDLIKAYVCLLKDPFNADKRDSVDANSEYTEGIIAEHQESGPYFFDDTFSLADVFVLPFLICYQPALSYYAAYDIFNKAPRLKKMFDAAMKRPSVKETTLKPEDYIAFCKKYVPQSHIMWSMTPGYVLFTDMKCPFADRIRLACAVKGIDLPTYVVDSHNLPLWYSWVNYRETVPTLLTPQGTYIHESQLVVHYIDDMFPEHGNTLLPKDAYELYLVRFFETNVSYFVKAIYSIFVNKQKENAKKELELVAGELEKLLTERQSTTKEKGPFFGGATFNAADVCLLPMLVRLKACTPQLTGGYDLFAKFKLLNDLLEAALRTEACKKVFLSLSEYLTIYKEKFCYSS